MKTTATPGTEPACVGKPTVRRPRQPKQPKPEHDKDHDEQPHIVKRQPPDMLYKSIADETGMKTMDVKMVFDALSSSATSFSKSNGGATPVSWSSTNPDMAWER